jgi:hypothetical protein
MNKDIIYLDAEDDITAIIEKIKNSKEKVIALVPPRRIGTLQSAVNLRLLQKTAEQNNKKIVLVTVDKALDNLAAVAKIPVAKNLQSKPEIPKEDEIFNDDEIDTIDGSKLPIGELEKTAPSDGDTHGLSRHFAVNDNTLDSIDLDDAPNRYDHDQPIVNSRSAGKALSNDVKNSKDKKAPDISSLRKKILIVLSGVIIVGGFLVWAIFFAPAATIIIKANTSSSNVSKTTTLSTTANTDSTQSVVRAVAKSIAKTETVKFTATGQQAKGDKATGTISLTNKTTSSAVYVPAGTQFSSGNYIFTSDSSVSVPGASVLNSSISGGVANVNVTATNIGPDYNLSERSYVSSIDGLSAYGSQMSGGTQTTVKIVTASDVQNATQSLVSQSTDSIKSQLKSQFGGSYKVISDSFNANRETPASSPAIGGESSDGTATLSDKVTYSLEGISSDELTTFLNGVLSAQLDNSSKQKVYDVGLNKVEFANYDSSANTVKINTTGQIGPKIDETAIKKQAMGKKFGDVQSYISSIDGVSSVDVKFSYFWVNTFPNDITKISIKFTVNND